MVNLSQLNNDLLGRFELLKILNVQIVKEFPSINNLDISTLDVTNLKIDKAIKNLNTLIINKIIETSKFTRKYSRHQKSFQGHIEDLLSFNNYKELNVLSFKEEIYHRVSSIINLEVINPTDKVILITNKRIGYYITGDECKNDLDIKNFPLNGRIYNTDIIITDLVKEDEIIVYNFTGITILTNLIVEQEYRRTLSCCFNLKRDNFDYSTVIDLKDNI